MKLLLNQGLPRGACALFASAGFVASHVGNIGYASANDETILALAKSDGSVVLTLDADFGALLAFSGAASPSVIRIRVEGLKAPALVGIIVAVIEQARADLEAGSLVVVEPPRIRVRRLPLLRHHGDAGPSAVT